MDLPSEPTSSLNRQTVAATRALFLAQAVQQRVGICHLFSSDLCE